MKNQRFVWPVRPAACKENMVAGERYRFTVLTDCLIRMEYDPDGIFEDRASQSVFFRDLPAVPFSVKREDGQLRIETGKLVLQYRENAPFSADSLLLRLKEEPASSWRVGDKLEDLGGTIRTLDAVDGRCPLGRGLCSRWGFSVLNDSQTMLLNEDGWVEVRRENTGDFYFFGYGYDYRGCIRDYYRITGVPPMLPAYALGNWWSRYHAYTLEEYLNLMQRCAEENLPFSVAVGDMDWHLVDVAEPSRSPKCSNGWTGYTWNEDLFPDYKAFLQGLHDRNLKTALNLHPADGVRRHEIMYEQMARAAGIDPASGETVCLDILSPERMADYFDIIHHPYERDGVDFWWMDWQQGTQYWWIHEENKPGEYLDPRERLDPLWMLNHLHILDISRNGKRPMFFSRYAGPGSQRYPDGFSCDTYVTWDSLNFQPYFTATASNIGYSWWSHDIGGHMRGYRDKELMVRWLQLGVFSPINRLHSTSSPWVEKEAWAYDAETDGVMRKWLRLRHQLFPYIYTMNYRTHHELEPLVQPMYYRHPKCGEAYNVPNQFWFGSELMVAPITKPNDPATGLGCVDVWFPEGMWFDWDNGHCYQGQGGRRLEVYRPLERMPVFARAGAILPMARYGDNRLINSENMEILVFPGADNEFAMYEDAGDGSEFENGSFSVTKMALSWGKTARFTIYPAQGDTSLIPKVRTWAIHLRGFHESAKVQVKVNGEKMDIPVSPDAAQNTLTVSVCAPVTAEIQLTVSGETLICDNSDAVLCCKDILRRAQISNDEKDRIWNVLNDNAKYAYIYRKMQSITGKRLQTRALEGAIREMLMMDYFKSKEEELKHAKVVK